MEKEPFIAVITTLTKTESCVNSLTVAYSRGGPVSLSITFPVIQGTEVPSAKAMVVRNKNNVSTKFFKILVIIYIFSPLSKGNAQYCAMPVKCNYKNFYKPLLK